VNWFSSSITRFLPTYPKSWRCTGQGKQRWKGGGKGSKKKGKEKFLRKSAFDEAFDTLDSELKKKGKPKKGAPSFNASYSAVTPYASPELTA
jgi:hypothetical protein